VTALTPGGAEHVVLHLPPGRWELSLPFVSQQAVRVRGAGLNVLEPPNLDWHGSVWRVGDVTSSGGPIDLTLAISDPAPIFSGSSSTQHFNPAPMVAVPLARSNSVPLRAACGRYVDWYELK
jgi:hypothetical protein